jgi:hypothetical protein
VALSEDQKAMLRLLAQREQGYDDLAALMGLSVDEVRAKVADALAQLEAEGEPAPAVPPPAPEGATPARPEAAAPEAALSEPETSEEEPPPPKREAPAAPPKAAAEPKPAAPKAGPKLSLPKDRGVQAAIGAGLLVVVVVVVLLIVSGSGGSGEGGSASGGSTANGTNAAAEEGSGLTQAILSPVDGGEGEGRALFGRVKKNVALQVEATGLEPSPAGSAYTIWLYKSPKLALRVGAVKVGKNGGLAVQLPIPTELLGYVSNGAFNQIDISLTGNAEYAAEVARSKKEKKLPEHVGTSVLRGTIEGPIIEQAEAEAEG